MFPIILMIQSHFYVKLIWKNNFFFFARQFRTSVIKSAIIALKCDGSNNDVYLLRINAGIFINECVHLATNEQVVLIVLLIIISIRLIWHESGTRNMDNIDRKKMYNWCKRLTQHSAITGPAI